MFKAIESDRTRDRLDRLTRRSVDSLPATNLGVIAEDLIYLVVLRDGRGICTVRFLSLEHRAKNLTDVIQFHFTDISGSHCFSDSSNLVSDRTQRTPRPSKGEGSPP